MKISIISLILITTFYYESKSQTKNFIDQPYIEINGYSDTLVTPNEIYIRFLISEKDSRDRVSIEESESKMYSGLKNLGIDVEKSLKTNDMGSNFRFYLLKRKDVIKSKEYVLKVNNAITASKVFILLEELDLSNAFIDRVAHSEFEKIKNLTRIKAVENAKAKAISMTTPLGQSVGQAIYMTDGESGNTNLEGLLTGKAAGVYLRGINSLDKNEEPKIDFEKIKISMTVSVKFILK